MYVLCMCNPANWLPKSNELMLLNISSSYFYWLRQILRLLDAESGKVLVHVFVSSCVDGCNALMAGSTKTTLIVFSV